MLFSSFVLFVLFSYSGGIRRSGPASSLTWWRSRGRSEPLAFARSLSWVGWEVEFESTSTSLGKPTMRILGPRSYRPRAQTPDTICSPLLIFPWKWKRWFRPNTNDVKTRTMMKSFWRKQQKEWWHQQERKLVFISKKLRLSAYQVVWFPLWTICPTLPSVKEGTVQTRRWRWTN